jgi:hypothetical protein
MMDEVREEGRSMRIRTKQEKKHEAREQKQKKREEDKVENKQS